MWVSVSSNGGLYYWNLDTEARQDEPPIGFDVYWRAVYTEDGKVYFWDTQTGATTYDRPRNGGVACKPPSEGSIDAAEATASYTKPAGPWIFQTIHRGARVPSDPVEVAKELQRQRLKKEAERVDAGCWVECENDKGSYFFYDAALNRSCDALPTGAKVLWRSYLAPSGQRYFENAVTRATTWRPPGGCVPRPGWVQIGAAVQINGDAQGRFHGQVGTVAFINEDGEAVVRLPDVMGLFAVSVPEQCLSCPRQGALVEVTVEVDGDAVNQVGVVEDGNVDSSNEMKVKLGDGGVVSVNVTAMRPQSRLWYVNLYKTGNFSPRRKCEQDCLFISDDGNHHRFRVHLPPNFAEGDKAYPLLVYMHGAGGGGLLSMSKRTFKMKGLAYVAHNFVIVTPYCTWKWKELPKLWVVDLVRQLRACSWVDTERVYLTGVSMGGMGTWEVAAMAPELFTAVAAVAATHQAGRDAYLVRRLCDMPALVVHSSGDSTCPIRCEEALWNSLQAAGHDRLQVCFAPDVDHNIMFERAYCDSEYIFEWLLAHRRCASEENRAGLG